MYGERVRERERVSLRYSEREVKEKVRARQ